MTSVRAHVYVSGNVQGVFFRHEASRRAASRGLSGWVRNLPDGRVEAVFEGAREDVESTIAWCRQGPRLADVRDVEVDWQEPEGEESFSIR